jgi:hypothetical protein
MLTERLAVFLALQPGQPDALAGRAAVLLDHARLKGTRLLETGRELLRRVVGKGVGQATGELLCAAVGYMTVTWRLRDGYMTVT